MAFYLSVERPWTPSLPWRCSGLLSYVGVTLASYRRCVGVVPSGAAALSRAGSSWGEGVELVGSHGGVQVAVVDEDHPEILAHGERRG
jgi:hypothetical protein